MISTIIAVAAAASSTPMTVFGLTLGQPLTIPECRRARLPDGRLSELVYEREPGQTCFEPDTPVKGRPWRRGSLDFPLDRIPTIMSGNSCYTLMIEGRLEGLDLDTPGPANAKEIIRQLSVKFGKAVVMADTVSIDGIPVPSTHARWHVNGVSVQYDSVGPGVSRGTLLIQTDKLRALREASDRANAESRTPL